MQTWNKTWDNIVMHSYVFCHLTIALTEVYAIQQIFYVDCMRDESSGVITSPGYPGTYPNNVNYTWILTTGHTKATVNFTLDMDIKKYESIPSCDDYLQIDEREPSYRQALRRCGQYRNLSLTVIGEKITVSFVSDDLHNAKGFNLTWKVHLPERIDTLKTTTTMLTTLTSTTTTTTPSTTPIIIPLTTLLILKTTLITSISQPSSPHVSSTSDIPSTRTTTIQTTRKKQTSTAFASTTTSVETTTVSITDSTKTQTKANTVTKPNNETSTEGFAGNRTPPLNPIEITYLILGISGAELMLIATGICIIKRRKKDSSIKANSRNIHVDKVHPISRKSSMNVANVYESIPLDHFSHGTIMEEEEDEGGVYVDIPEHVYDRSFVHRPHFNKNVHVYQLISELKNKKA